MIIPKGVDANPYTLTEIRELVLRCYATEANAHTPTTVTIERPIAQPLPVRPRDLAEAHAWLRAHNYVDADGLTSRGWQVAAHLSRGDRHDPWFDAVQAVNEAGTGLVTGTRVRCSCGWGGARNEQGPSDLRVPYPPHRGGREAAARLFSPHLREMRGEPTPAPKPTRDPFAGLPAVNDEPW